MKARIYFYGLVLSLSFLPSKGFGLGSKRIADRMSRILEGGQDTQMSVLVTMSRAAAADRNWVETLKWLDLYDKRLKENGQTMATNKDCCELYIFALENVGDKVKASQYRRLCFSLEDSGNQEKFLEELAFIGQYKFKDIRREPISNPGSDEFSLNFISDKLVLLSVARDFKDVSDMPISKKRERYAIPKSVNHSSTKDIYVAEYFEGQILDPEMLKGEINTDYAETTPVFSPKRKELYFSRTVPIFLGKGTSKGDEKYTIVTRIFKAVFDNMVWRVLGECDINVGKYSAMHPAVSPDGRKMYFVSDMPSGYGGYDIYEVDIYKDGSFGKPENLGGSINSPGNEVYLNINESGDLYFASDGLYGYGGFDVFVTYLEDSPFPDEDRHYHAALNLGYPVNTYYDDFGFSCASDGISCFFSSNRPNREVSSNLGDISESDMQTFGGDVDLFSVQVVGDIFLQTVPSGTTLDNLRDLSDEDRARRMQLKNPLTGISVQDLSKRSLTSYPVMPEMISVSDDEDFPQDAFELDHFERKDSSLDVSPLQKALSAENILKLSVIYFSFGETSLNEAGKKLLDNIALLLEKDKDVNIEIQGHADDIGPKDFNHSLSLKRALVAKKYLISRGIDAYRLAVKGYGETRPRDLINRENNRRVEFEVQ